MCIRVYGCSFLVLCDMVIDRDQIYIVHCRGPECVRHKTQTVHHMYKL